MKEMIQGFKGSEEDANLQMMRRVERRLLGFFPQGFTQGQKILAYVALALLALGSNAIMVTLSRYMFDFRKQSSLPITHNFLPAWFFFLGFIVWLLCLYLGRRLEDPVRILVYLSGPTLFWIFMELQLLLGTMYSGTLGLPGILFVYFTLLSMVTFLLMRRLKGGKERVGKTDDPAILLHPRIKNFVLEQRQWVGGAILLLIIARFVYQGPLPEGAQILLGMGFWLLLDWILSFWFIWVFLPYALLKYEES